MKPTPLNNLMPIERPMTFEEKRQKIQSLDSTLLLRYSYVPFVMAEGAWDYADTVIDMAINMGITQTKKLSRTIRTFRRNYERLRQRDTVHNGVSDRQCRQGEMDNFLMLESFDSEFFNGMNTMLRETIRAQYPELGDEWQYLLAGVYNCHILLRAIYKYTDIMAEQVREACGFDRIGDILPQELRQLDRLVLEYAGDKRLKVEEEQSYIDNIVDKLLTVRFTDVESGKEVPCGA